jgi:hypothetical protein
LRPCGLQHASQVEDLTVALAIEAETTVPPRKHMSVLGHGSHQHVEGGGLSRPSDLQSDMV